MTDGFERNDMNNMNDMNNTNSENEQVQNSFSTAGNSQTDTSANASGYNAGSSYTSSYDAQQNAYNSYYNYANGANNTGANNIHVAPGANKPPKKNGKGALVAGIIAAALVVGGGAGFAGTVLGNSINATIPFASSSTIHLRANRLTAAQKVQSPHRRQRSTPQTRRQPLPLTKAR